MYADGVLIGKLVCGMVFRLEILKRVMIMEKIEEPQKLENPKKNLPASEEILRKNSDLFFSVELAMVFSTASMKFWTKRMQIRSRN